MIKKEITFIYMDSAEKGIMEPIQKEAEKRGYKTVLTKDKFARCEIGVYCQHVNFPQYSKFSVIMLHDIIQQYGNWPDLWLREPWNKYDVGILPSDQWCDNWMKCSKYYYSRPKNGVYKIGWPKADIVAGIDVEERKKEFNNKYGLDSKKKTVLYAPAWENDGKQDEFVKAMLPVGVNILIKQYPATEDVQPQQYINIKEMYQLHKDISGVTILDPRTNIFDAIVVSDILVSEESSTMAESVMMGIPAVSVSDWLIPDTIPSRYPECNYDFVVKTTKKELSNCVKNIVDNYAVYKKETENNCKKIFCNIGRASSMIMDIIDDCVKKDKIRYDKLIPEKKQMVPLKKYIKHIGIVANREVTQNYALKSKIVRIIWKMLRFFKKLIYKKPFEE